MPVWRLSAMLSPGVMAIFPGTFTDFEDEICLRSEPIFAITSIYALHVRIFLLVLFHLVRVGPLPEVTCVKSWDDLQAIARAISWTSRKMITTYLSLII